jgi:hypothetical protein
MSLVNNTLSKVQQKFYQGIKIYHSFLIILNQIEAVINNISKIEMNHRKKDKLSFNKIMKINKVVK